MDLFMEFQFEESFLVEVLQVGGLNVLEGAKGNEGFGGVSLLV